MIDKHESQLLNRYIGTNVRIVFKDNKEKIGILKPIDFGFGYKLIIPEGSYIFTKSQVKKIEEVK